MTTWFQCSACSIVTMNRVEAECHRLEFHGVSATYTPFEVEPVSDTQGKPFDELVDQPDFFRAHSMGVVLDDVLDQANLETWMTVREAAGWANDGGRP
jgi:hypothetical protein